MQGWIEQKPNFVDRFTPTSDGVLRAAVQYQRSGFGKALVVGREADVAEKLAAEGMAEAASELEVVNAANTPHLDTYKAFLYVTVMWLVQISEVPSDGRLWVPG